jgi:hypothetical protein
MGRRCIEVENSKWRGMRRQREGKLDKERLCVV